MTPATADAHWALLDAAPDAMVIADAQGRITFANAQTERMFGHIRSELNGAPLETLLPARYRQQHGQYLAGFLAAPSTRPGGPGLELFGLRKDGREFPVEIALSSIRVADETMVIAAVRDITERIGPQAASREREGLLSSIYDTVSDVIFQLAVEHGGRYRFVSVNKQFSAVTGLRAEQVVGKYVDEIIPEPSLALVQGKYAEAVRDKGSVRWDEVSEYPTGKLTGEVCVTPVLDAAGRCTHLVGSVHDVTMRKRIEDELRKSEERYRTTLETILEGCQLLGFDWRYLYLNPAAAIQNRRPNAELLGHRMQDAWPGIDATDVFALLRRCMEERVRVQAEIEFAFADGYKGWFDVRAQPVPEGIFVLSNDISERKQVEKALRELNQDLERKVAERTLDLDAAKERAESADRLKSAFLATMSHELRTPLNSIIGFTGIILQELPGPLNAEQTKQLGMVRSSARHLLELINDVLDISKIEAGEARVALAPFDLRATIERSVVAVRPFAQTKGLALRLEMSPAIGDLDSDARRVQQILLNLLNNAVKFTERGEVVLSADVVDEKVRVRIIDTGIGIKPEDLANLFQPFRQVESGLTRSHEGTGLGLVICRRLAGLLGGEVRAESRPDEGSTFTVILPLRRAVKS